MVLIKDFFYVDNKKEVNRIGIEYIQFGSI